MAAYTNFRDIELDDFQWRPVPGEEEEFFPAKRTAAQVLEGNIFDDSPPPVKRHPSASAMASRSQPRPSEPFETPSHISRTRQNDPDLTPIPHQSSSAMFRSSREGSAQPDFSPRRPGQSSESQSMSTPIDPRLLQQSRGSVTPLVDVSRGVS